MDVVLSGDGRVVKDVLALLTPMGVQVGRDPYRDRLSPVILGDVPHPFAQALEHVVAGRHLLVANPQSLSDVQIAGLLAARRPRQALFLWSERRYHPAYRLITRLVRSDEGGWRPRYSRQVTLSRERPTQSALRWQVCESLAIVLGITGREPDGARAQGAMNSWRGATDFVSIAVEMQGLMGFLEIGLGEDRVHHEMVLAATDRKVHVDELRPTEPLRLADDGGGSTARSVRCRAPTPGELTRLQLRAFLEAIDSAARSQVEADLWLRVIGCWQAIDASLEARGLQIEVRQPSTLGLRVLNGRGLVGLGLAPRLKVIS